MKYLAIIILVFASLITHAQKERKFIRHGNKYYNTAVENSDSTRLDSVNFTNAEIEYRKALEKKPNDQKSQLNIGNALFKQQKMAEAASQYEQALQVATTNEDKAKTHFNYGNAMLGQQKLDESIEAYKNALRNDPTDLQAKYNLEFARKMKEQQQENQDQNQDQDQDQNKDQNKDQDQNQDKDQDKDQDQKKDQDQDQKKEQQQQQPKISKQNAEQMLKALENDEQKTQEKVNKAKAEKAKSSKPDIDW